MASIAADLQSSKKVDGQAVTPPESPAELQRAFAEAEAIAIVAGDQFARTVEAHNGDPRPALKIMNKGVSRWSNTFTSPRHRRFLYTLGSAMDGETHVARITFARFQRKYLKQHGETISKSTIIRRIEELETAAILAVSRTKQDLDDEHPGMNGANSYEVRTWKVIRKGETLPFDFVRGITIKIGPDLGRDPENDTKRGTKLDAKLADKVGAKLDDITISNLLASLNDSSNDSSSSPRQPSGPGPDAHDDDRRSGRFSGARTSPQAGAEAAQEDSSGGSTSAQARATRRSARSRTARPGQSAEAVELVQAMEKHLAEELPGLNPRLMIKRIDEVAAEFKVTVDVIDQALAKIYVLNDPIVDVIKAKPNPPGYLHEMLPDIVQHYIKLRKEKAEELGEDPETFNYFRWLDDQVEEEAEAAQADDAQDEDDHAEAASDEAKRATAVPYRLQWSRSYGVGDHKTPVFTRGRPEDDSELRLFPEVMARELGEEYAVYSARQSHFDAMLKRHLWSVEDSKPVDADIARLNADQ
jgi:hypothetical protein